MAYPKFSSVKIFIRERPHIEFRGLSSLSIIESEKGVLKNRKNSEWFKSLLEHNFLICFLKFCDKKST